MHGSKIIALLLFIPCASLVSQKTSNDQVLLSNHKIAYVEEHKPYDGTPNGEFGDVVLFDLQTKQKYYVTDDSYLDASPCISPDGRFVVFASKRLGNPALLQVEGVAGRRELYIFDTTTKSTRRFAELVQKKYSNQMYDFTSLAWAGKQSLLFSQGNEVFILSTYEDSLWRLAHLDTTLDINSFFINPKKDLIALSSMNYDSLYSVVSLINIERGSTSTILKVKRWAKVQGWTSKGEAFLISAASKDTSFLLYQVHQRKLRPLRIPGEGVDFNSSEALFLSNDTLLVLAARLPSRQTDLLLFDMNSNAIEWLTNDPYTKSDLYLPLPPK